jgi:hypothetical protein
MARITEALGCSHQTVGLDLGNLSTVDNSLRSAL